MCGKDEPVFSSLLKLLLVIGCIGCNGLIGDCRLRLVSITAPLDSQRPCAAGFLLASSIIILPSIMPRSQFRDGTAYENCKK